MVNVQCTRKRSTSKVWGRCSCYILPNSNLTISDSYTSATCEVILYFSSRWTSIGNNACRAIVRQRAIAASVSNRDSCTRTSISIILICRAFGEVICVKWVKSNSCRKVIAIGSVNVENTR